MRALLMLLLAIVLAVVGIWFVAGRSGGPAVDLRSPGEALGAQGTLDLAVESAGGRVTHIDVTFEQEGREHTLFSLDDPSAASVVQEAADRIRVTRPIGRDDLPGLRSGAARISVTATRPILFGLSDRATTLTRDLQIRLEPPRLAILSTHHYVNHAGSEMIVYRVEPPDVESGVRVGEREYSGFPAAGTGITGADASLKVAFFAVPFDEDLGVAIEAFARDDVGNESRAAFEYRVFPRPFRRSRIDVTDRFLQQVVPAIAERTPELSERPPFEAEQLLEVYLRINGELRHENNDRLAALAADTSPEMLWEGPFEQLPGSQVESSFADHRTYFYQGEEIDQQVHLGFDLASTALAAVTAANRGRVVFADYLGIYGNAVVLDHGMGVQTLYAHLSSIDVEPGDVAQKGQAIGRTGMTGLAGGDHLHFTVMVHGQPVTPVDWWSAQWIEDRIQRKLREAGQPVGRAADRPPADQRTGRPG